jgi:predicted alpha/beta-hydrolase family hydrolase
MPSPLSIPVDDRKTTGLAYAAERQNRIGATLVLAHGAGANQSSRFMVDFATALAGRGIDVLTFNFLYTEERRKVPDRTPLLEACYRAVVDAARSYPRFMSNKVFIGGKSMGGRMATHLAAADDATAAGLSGVVVLGYPLHPPGKPEQLRIEHLPRIKLPMLIIQGERDPFGSPDELRPHFATLGELATIHAVAGGDHSLVVRSVRPQPDHTTGRFPPPYRGVRAEQPDLAGIVATWIQRHL